MTARTVVVLQAFDKHANLINALFSAPVETIFCCLITRPIYPLRAIDGPKVAPLFGEICIVNNPLLEILLRDDRTRFTAIAVQRPVSPNPDLLL